MAETAFLVQLGPKDLRVTKDPQDLLETRAPPLKPMYFLDRLDLPGSLDPKDLLVCLDFLEGTESQEHKESAVGQDRQGSLENPATQVQKVLKVETDLLVTQEPASVKMLIRLLLWMLLLRQTTGPGEQAAFPRMEAAGFILEGARGSRDHSNQVRVFLEPDIGD